MTIDVDGPDMRLLRNLTDGDTSSCISLEELTSQNSKYPLGNYQITIDRKYIGEPPDTQSFMLYTQINQSCPTKGHLFVKWSTTCNGLRNCNLQSDSGAGGCIYVCPCIGQTCTVLLLAMSSSTELTSPWSKEQTFCELLLIT